MTKTKAVRMYGAEDIRLEEFDLPEITADEILMRVISDSLCLSTYKAMKQGVNHKRVPPDIAENPIIIGHEMCGEIVEVGANVEGWKVGQKAVVQPALKLDTGYDPGYSYPYIGGDATYVIVPKIVLERGCLVHYEGDSYFKGSLVESFGCILRGYKGFYHTDYTNYVRTDGVKKGGKLAILGGAGPMGLGAVEFSKKYGKCSQVVVTDLSKERLAYAASKCTVENAKACGCDLHYIDTSNIEDVASYLLELSNGGFDDVFVMVPVPALFTLAEQICCEDGCVNFFAGPAIHNLQGSLNLYRVHYDGIHVVGTAGSIPEDTVETIACIEKDDINPAVVVSHILGLNAVVDAMHAMATPNGAKKVCYTGINLPMTAIDDLPELGKTNPLFKALADIVARNGGLWCAEAEAYLLANAPKM